MAITKLPKQYQWLEKESGPKMLLTFLQFFGLAEVPGKGNNPIIMGWVKELGIKNYTNDDIAWCGLLIAYLTFKAGRVFVLEPLWARNWLNHGTKVEPGEEMFCDILVFKRPGGGGHVGLYIGEDKTHFHVAGGNQGNSVSIVRIAKDRLLGCRRPPYTIQPNNIRKVYLGDKGIITNNEQ